MLFQSTLCDKFTKLQGVKHKKPQHTILVPIVWYHFSTWFENLPLLLLSIQNVFRQNLGCTPSEMVFSTSVTLQGQYYEKTNHLKPTMFFVEDYLFLDTASIAAVHMVHLWLKWLLGFMIVTHKSSKTLIDANSWNQKFKQKIIPDYTIFSLFGMN